MDIVQQLTVDDATCEASLDFGTVTLIVIITCVLGLIWAAYNFYLVRKINVERGEDGESDSLIGDIPEGQKKLLIELGEKISNVISLLNLGRYRIP
jgi:hypothetical protein